MRRILSYLKPYAAFVTLSLTVKIVATLLELAIPYLLSYIIDDVITPLDGAENIDTRAAITEIVLLSLAMIGFALLAVVGTVTSARMASRTAKNVSRAVRHDLFDATMQLSPAQLDRFTVPSLESRLTSDTYNIHRFINSMQRMGVRAPILLFGGLIITATLDPVLTLCLAAILPFIFIIVTYISMKGLPMFTRSQGSLDAMTRVVREDAQGVRVIKALSKVEYENARYDEVNRALVRDEMKANITMAMSHPFMNLFMNIGRTAIIIVGAYRVHVATSEPGKIIAFMSYLTIISMAMMTVSRVFVLTSKAMASAARIAEVLDAEKDLCVIPSELLPPMDDGDDYIVFDRVEFAYEGMTELMHDISFRLRRGGTLGIIGATGSGKTTIINLLMRFYDPDAGSIRIGGRDLRTIPEEELHSMFGVAMQNDFIVNDSIRENIKFGRDISDDQMRRAARIAQADGFIEAYDDGYDHELAAKGANISGGQKQRVILARAMAGEPDILILDDSSSALDYKTDAELRRAIKCEMSGTTTVVVAQRVSSVMSADLILLIDDGRIIGQGTHDELMASSEVYSEIARSQMGGAFLE